MTSAGVEMARTMWNDRTKGADIYPSKSTSELSSMIEGLSDIRMSEKDEKVALRTFISVLKPDEAGALREAFTNSQFLTNKPRVPPCLLARPHIPEQLRHPHPRHQPLTIKPRSQHQLRARKGSRPHPTRRAIRTDPAQQVGGGAADEFSPGT